MNLKKYISNVANNLTHSEIDAVFERAASMEDVVNLAMGQPDLNTPDSASRKAVWAIENNYTKYTDDLGLASLREEISKYLARRCDLNYDPDSEIIVFAGVSNAIDTALRTIVNLGDEIIVQQPSYSSYVPAVQLAGGVPVILETYEDEEFNINPERLRSLITEKTKALIISYPNNPTGAMMSKEDLIEISKIAEETDIIVISDEIYSEMVYEDGFTSFAALPGMKERTITANGVSKTFSMTGWRVGYACAPSDIVDAMLKVHQYTVMNVPSISQYAAAEAMRSEEKYIKEICTIYNKRRDYVFDRLEKMGIRCYKPKGTFYVFPSIKETGMDSKLFCERLLEEYGVALVPGTEFGECGDGYVRLSYTTTMENLKKGMDRMENFIKEM